MCKGRGKGKGGAATATGSVRASSADGLALESAAVCGVWADGSWPVFRLRGVSAVCESDWCRSTWFRPCESVCGCEREHDTRDNRCYDAVTTLLRRTHTLFLYDA